MTKYRYGLAVALACSACVGVPSSPNEEQVGRVESALDQGCRNLSPVVTFTGSINYTSARTYSQPGCFKSEVVQFTATGTGGNGGGSTGSGGAHARMFSVSWADTPPSTATACANAWIGGYRFTQSSDGTYETAEISGANGVWMNNACVGPKFDFAASTFIEAIPPTKFAVSARTAQTSGAATRQYNISGPFLR